MKQPSDPTIVVQCHDEDPTPMYVSLQRAVFVLHIGVPDFGEGFLIQLLGRFSEDVTEEEFRAGMLKAGYKHCHLHKYWCAQVVDAARHTACKEENVKGYFSCTCCTAARVRNRAGWSDDSCRRAT